MRARPRKHSGLLVAILTMLVAGTLCRAAEPAPPATRPADRVLPPVEELLPEEDTLAARVEVVVRAFRFEGNTVFSDEELRQVLQDYVGRRLTSEDLHEARRALTLHYVNAGYMNSGAVLPDQAVEDNAITFLIVEGELTEVAIKGNERTKTDYIRKRVERGAGRPLNLRRLQDNLEVLRQGPLFDRIEGELQPGAKPGQSRLTLSVEEARPWYALLEFANDESPSIGAERLRLLLGHRNLTGVGDTLSLRYGLTTGGISDMRYARLDDVGVVYSRPLNAYDTTLLLGYDRTNSLLIEDPFADLDVTSDTETFTVGVRHPFYRTPHSEFAASLIGEVRTSETKLLGKPFSLEPGAEEGRTRVSVVRFAQDWTTRDERRAFAARSTFSLGLPAFGATDNSGVADSEFLAWLGQLRYAQRLGTSDNRVILSLSTQLASDSLLSLEQFGIGGRHTVRGYRENEIVRDNGVVASAEMRLPVLRDSARRRPVLSLAPFFDIGYGWDTHSPKGYEVLPSVGLGLLLDLQDWLQAELFWGATLKDFDHAEHDLQDTGIHFRVLVGRF